MATVTREIFSWRDPESKKKFKDICTTPQMMYLLEDVIETEEQAESFFEAYSEASKNAEHNLGYFINLIKDSDVREDAFDLFLVDPQISPMQMLDRPYSLSPWVRNNG